MKCDCEIESRWYESSFSATVQAEYEKLEKEVNDVVVAENKLIAEYPMIYVDSLRDMMHGRYKCSIGNRI